ncbi:ATP-grasp ribosomal peptide maturase [Salinispora arenicola]|uniref:ATP-grasp ribosomal peptide maturase n=1 Tax=Salinispora arenicola TaxID=168697 RepID=A0A542XMQ9_SALAC|nr:ATP-grasp ribosomal peptide maturase [Salinispora arenicola]TQL36943.1 ATP-grasp ribosomal peptide maturase [Salinispora arenicola]GIM87214.1 ATP-grasp ribosomal peptide maturase [Salinispora arenicola]
MTILVLTEPRDVTADLVITALHNRDAKVHRVDTGDFPQSLALAAENSGQGGWSGVLTDAHRQTRIEDVSAVYYRRPSPFQLADGLDDYERRWATQEARMGFGGLVAALPVQWVNHPHRMAAADYKPVQLAVAARCGLTTPRTVITNEARAARAFVAAAPDGAIYKPLRVRPYLDTDTGHLMALATTPVTAEQITDAVTGTAHLFQHQIPKDHELRVTVIGRRVFAARIDAHSDAARIDWRTDYDNLTYAPVTLPDTLTDQLLSLTNALGLAFAAIDLIVTPTGDHVFLEVNPGGQWAWIEAETGLPIATAIAEYLETP